MAVDEKDIISSARHSNICQDLWEDWVDEDAEEVAICLFCSDITAKPDVILEHCRVEHGFDLRLVKQALGLDLYGVIKLVNYVRDRAKENPHLSIHNLSETLIPSAEWLKGDNYLKPVLDGDPMLYALEDDNDETFTYFENIIAANTASLSINELPSATIAQRRLSNPCITGSTVTLQAALVDAQKRAVAAEERANNILNAWKDYRQEITKAVLGSDRYMINKPDDDEGDYYFGSYAENDIHESMLKDKIRTEAYRDFIYNNKVHFEDKVVLDIGCGTAILSMFAAKAGAKQVFAVDNSSIIYKAKSVVAENGLESIITCIQGKVEDVELPVDKVDIIISEWMGYFLLFEGMLDSVIKARDRWLKPNGLMVPNVAKMYLAGIEDEDWVNEKYSFWNDVYGFKMWTMKKSFFENAHVEICDTDTIITQATLFKELDLNNITCEALDFTASFSLMSARPGKLHALCGWFDIDFISPSNSVSFSTSPSRAPTHWKQCWFAVERPIDIKLLGDSLECLITIKKRRDNARELDVSFKISYDGKVDELVRTVR